MLFTHLLMVAPWPAGKNKWGNPSLQALEEITEKRLLNRKQKGRLRPMLGFKTFYNARRVIIGIELVYCPESSRRYFGRLFADSFVALPRKTPGIPASRASLTTKIHPELTPRTSRTAH